MWADYVILLFSLIRLNRCLAVLAEKVTQTTAMDDKKIRKELQVRKLYRQNFAKRTNQTYIRNLMENCSIHAWYT